MLDYWPVEGSLYLLIAADSSHTAIAANTHFSLVEGLEIFDVVCVYGRTRELCIEGFLMLSSGSCMLSGWLAGFLF